MAYVERHDGLLVFDHRNHPEAGTQVPAGSVDRDDALVEAAIREVREETGVGLDDELMLLGTHEHLDGLGRPSLSQFFRGAAPDGLPRSWQHTVSGGGDDATLVFVCRFDPAPGLSSDQALFHR